MTNTEAIRKAYAMTKGALVTDLIRAGVYADPSWSRDELVSCWLGKYGETASYSFPAPVLTW